ACQDNLPDRARRVGLGPQTIGPGRTTMRAQRPVRPSTAFKQRPRVVFIDKLRNGAGEAWAVLKYERFGAEPGTSTGASRSCSSFGCRWKTYARVLLRRRCGVAPSLR